LLIWNFGILRFIIFSIAHEWEMFYSGLYLYARYSLKNLMMLVFSGFEICFGNKQQGNHKIAQSQNPAILCIEYIIFDACGLFVKKNSGSFSAVLRA